MEPPVCRNIRSRRHPDQRCNNPASHGEYCGVHYKFPRPFKSANEIAVRKQSIEISPIVDPRSHAIKVQKWWRLRGSLRICRRQGPVRFYRELANNATDFYSMEPITGLSGEYIFSYIDGQEKQVYAFDVRSFTSLLEQEIPQNPYTRRPFSEAVLKKGMSFIRWCRKKGIDTRWAPIDAVTPEQRFQIKVTDLFQKIDELNYYTNPEWFIKLTADKLRCFYVELYDIWYHRAELSSGMRSTICPPPAKPFRYTIQDVVAMKNIDTLRKLTMDTTRMLISAATDKPDRTLGAMYVVTALTLVSRPCAEMYPWLFESATPGIYARYRTLTEGGLPPATLTALNLINTILAGQAE
jgi:hypothetical protein